MLKRISFALVVSYLGLALFAVPVFAYPVTGSVFPEFDTSTNGTATYQFTGLPSTASFLAVAFPSNTFNWFAPVPASQTQGALVLPGGNALGLLQWQVPDLTFKVSFSLVDMNYNWEQQFWGFGLNGCNWVRFCGTTDATVSNPPVPEPATMLMLGISMVSFAGYQRMREKKS
jgi:hypothetical protein